MLRAKQQRVVVTFHTTDAALQTEREAQAAGLDGRLIPVPREISAGCGLAWSAPPESEEALRELLASYAVAWQEIRQLVL